MMANTNIKLWYKGTLSAMNARLSTLRSLVLIALLLCSPSIAVADITLGRQQFAIVDAFPLRMTVSSSPVFFTRVGGVAFSEEAIGEDGLVVVGMRYEAQRPDGERLSVQVRDRAGAEQWLTASIHDWALAPIARYAASEYDSAFTIFGQAEDVPDETQRTNVEVALEQGARLVQYHEAFEDELMGLRLFQADTLLLTDDSKDVFRVNGTAILGGGEAEPTLALNSTRFDLVQNQIAELTDTGAYSEVWATPREGAQTYSWSMFVAASETILASAVAEWIDIDLVATHNGKAIAEDNLDDSEPVVEVSGISGVVTFTLRVPEGTPAGTPVLISAERVSQSERTWVMPDTDESTFRWTINADKKRAYTVAGESPDGHDIDLEVRQGERVLMSDAAMDAYPVVVFGDTPGEVTVELTVPETMKPGDQVIITEFDVPNNGYQSYVITDSGKRGKEHRTTFGKKGSQLTLRGDPYWQMWRWSVQYQFRVSAALEAGVEAEEPCASDVVIDRPLSAAVSDAIRENQGINPAVYDAISMTMRYSALFRHYKSRDPEGYGKFVESISHVRTSPVQPVDYEIKTPNLWIQN